RSQSPRTRRERTVTISTRAGSSRRCASASSEGCVACGWTTTAAAATRADALTEAQLTKAQLTKAQLTKAQLTRAPLRDFSSRPLRAAAQLFCPQRRVGRHHASALALHSRAPPSAGARASGVAARADPRA